MGRETGGCRRAAGRRRHPDKDAAILDATLTALAEQGFTRMTIADIAKTAGVSKATIYLRWCTKGELAAAALRTLRPGTVPSTAAGTVDGVRALLIMHLKDFVQTLTRRHAMALIGTCLAEEEHTPQLLRLLREQVILPRREALRGILSQARACGELRADTDPDAVVSVLLGACYADCLAGRTDSPCWAQRIVDAVLGPATEH